MSAIIVISPKLFASEVSELLSRLLGNTRPSRPYYPPPTIRRPDESNKKKKFPVLVAVPRATGRSPDRSGYLLGPVRFEAISAG